MTLVELEAGRVEESPQLAGGPFPAPGDGQHDHVDASGFAGPRFSGRIPSMTSTLGVVRSRLADGGQDGQSSASAQSWSTSMTR